MQRILAVDDDKDILEVLEFILEDSGYNVRTLSEGRNLLAEIKNYDPDLILLDVMLGGLDGRELCREIKTNAETRHIPVILFSAGHNIARLIHQQFAPNAFLEKPFDISTLLDAVRSNMPSGLKVG